MQFIKTRFEKALETTLRVKLSIGKEWSSGVPSSYSAEHGRCPGQPVRVRGGQSLWTAQAPYPTLLPPCPGEVGRAQSGVSPQDCFTVKSLHLGIQPSLPASSWSAEPWVWRLGCGPSILTSASALLEDTEKQTECREQVNIFGHTHHPSLRGLGSTYLITVPSIRHNWPQTFDTHDLTHIFIRWVTGHHVVIWQLVLLYYSCREETAGTTMVARQNIPIYSAPRTKLWS